jgi:hypothetical protein
MHAPLSIKKVMSMQCVCMHPLTIIIKKYLSAPNKGTKEKIDMQENYSLFSKQLEGDL